MEGELEKLIYDVEFDRRDGFVVWRKRYADNSTGPWVPTNIKEDDQSGLINLDSDLRSEFDLPPKTEKRL